MWRITSDISCQGIFLRSTSRQNQEKENSLRVLMSQQSTDTNEQLLRLKRDLETINKEKINISKLLEQGIFLWLWHDF